MKTVPLQCFSWKGEQIDNNSSGNILWYTGPVCFCLFKHNPVNQIDHLLSVHLACILCWVLGAPRPRRQKWWRFFFSNIICSAFKQIFIWSQEACGQLVTLLGLRGQFFSVQVSPVLKCHAQICSCSLVKSKRVNRVFTSTIHSFIQQVFIECLLCARHCHQALEIDKQWR